MVNHFGTWLRKRPIAVLPASVALLMGSLLFNGRVPFRQLIEDPFWVGRIPPWTGILSNLGVAAWLAAAVCSLFAGGILRRSGLREESSSFLITAGLLSAYLAMDDFFLFHDWIAPTYLHVEEHFIIAFDALLVALFGWRFRQMLFGKPSWLLRLSILLLVASVAADAVHDFARDWLEARIGDTGANFLEDAPKVEGIVLWACYLVRESARQISTRLSPAIPRAGRVPNSEEASQHAPQRPMV